MATMREMERGLVEAGVPPERAEAFALALEDRLAEMATKADVDELRGEVRTENAKLREEMREQGDRLQREIRLVQENLQRQLALIDQSHWRLTLMVMSMWAATFGALMYAVFGG